MSVNKFLFIIIIGLFLILTPLLGFATEKQAPSSQTVSPPEKVAVTDLIIYSNPGNRDSILELMLEEDFAKAISLLENEIQKQEKLVPKSTLSFLMGILLLKKGAPNEAENFLKEALANSPYLKDYINLWIARSLNAQQKYEEASNGISLPQSFFRQIDFDLFWEKVETLISLKEWAQLNILLQIHEKEVADKNPQEKIKIAFYWGKKAWEQGAIETAKARWKKLLINDPGNQFEKSIFSYLIKDSKDNETILTNHEWLERADHLMGLGLPFMALPIYKKLHSPSNNLNLKIADAAFKSRNYLEAATLYQNMWDNPEPNQDRTMILSKLSTSYARSDQFDEAIKYNKQKEKLFADSKIADKASTKLAFLYFDSGDYKKAKKAYTKFLSTKTGTSRLNLLWKRLWSSMLLNEYDSALIDLKEYEQLAHLKDEKRTAIYWQARCLDLLGREDEAQNLYKSLVEYNNTDYYGFLANERYKNGDIYQLSFVAHFQPDTLPKDNFNVQSIHEELLTSDPMVQAILLAQIGLTHYAYEESERSPIIQEKGIIEKAPLLLLSQNYRRVHTIGLSLAKQKSTTLGTNAWYLSYPQAYPLWTMHFAKKYNLDPKLAWSLMRQESAFKPLVTSKANAIGLMQIIPQTGEEITKELNKIDFHETDLKDPVINIEYGLWYLKQRINQFDSNLVYAFASYNAGPDAVSRWKKWGDKLEFDEFIELIPYKETNHYVKKVLTNYWIYRKLY